MKNGRYSDAQIIHCRAAHVYMCEGGGVKAGRERCSDFLALPGAWNEQRKLL